MRKHFRAANPSAGESQAGFVGWEGRVRFSLGNVAGGPGWRLRPLPQERLFAVGGLGASLAGEGAPGPPHCSAAARWDRGSRGAGGCPSSACGVPWRVGGGGRGGPALLCEFCAPPRSPLAPSPVLGERKQDAGGPAPALAALPASLRQPAKPRRAGAQRSQLDARG